MNRRELLSKFGLLSAISIGFNIPIFGKKSYKVTIYNESILPENNTFNNPDEFWSKHDDQFSCHLNEKFIQSGKLLSVKTYLSKDKKSAYLVKIYRSKADHLEYVQILSDHHKKNTFSNYTSHKILPGSDFIV